MKISKFITLTGRDPSRWNKTPEVLKKTNSINTFKHNLKKYYLTQHKHAENKL